ncbi:MAG: alginate export family protein [Luteolibacter sp.]|uniref:alginate export family protein n=1 Tax=Luteolibacter sp. TaxID=1962973 RepID=UPI00326422EC
MRSWAQSLVGLICASAVRAGDVRSSGDFQWSIGGEIRERYEAYSEPFFGLRGLDQDDYLLHRLLVDADVHVGDRLRFFVQLGDYLEAGKEAQRSPTDVDEIDFQQAFVDFTTPLENATLLIRAGRQQMTLGSGRLVSVREGANIRRSFDGLRLTISSGGATFDAFALRTVELEVGGFNDNSNPGEALWGMYGVLPVKALPDGHVDLYYLGLERDDAVFEQGTGDERRNSFGTRLWGKPGGWDYNYEALIQTGTFGDADIVAWTIATDTGFTWKSSPFTPRLGFKADIASGDGDPSDGSLNTFNALFPKQPYFSEASLIAPANIMDLHPSLSLDLSDQVTLTTSWNVFWKQRVNDAVYAPPGRPLVAAGQSDSRYVGNQVNLELEWQLRENISWTFYYSHFFVGPAITGDGGRDVDFFGTWASLEF